MSVGFATGPIRQLEDLYGTRLTPDQAQAVHRYIDLLRRWNRRLSLTATRKTGEVLRVHFFESFWAADKFLGEKTAVADVGTGAGFPGLAMKLYRTTLRLTLVEKNHKKVAFLKEVSRTLGLKVEIFHGAAEQFDGWEHVQVVMLRALKPSEQFLRTLSSHGLRLLCFHGKRLDELLVDLAVLKQVRVPGTRNRHVSLLQC